MARAVQRKAARRDFIIHYAYLMEEAGPEIAMRFRDSVERTYADLAEMPGMGSPGKVLQDKHKDIRIWPVRGFENYLIAYRRLAVGVAIERLIHAKQDYMRVLG
jgi:plasmid stabilization system protein ParE